MTMWTIESAIRQAVHGQPGDLTDDARLFLHEQVQQYVNGKQVLLAAATAVMLLDAIAELRLETASAQQEPAAQAEGVKHVLAAVAGTVFRSGIGEVIILLDTADYVISVDSDGDTASAYLVTVPPADIAQAMDADPREIGGWSTGYDI
jgi:hypothetical protein